MDAAQILNNDGRWLPNAMFCIAFVSSNILIFSTRHGDETARVSSRWERNDVVPRNRSSQADAGDSHVGRRRGGRAEGGYADVATVDHRAFRRAARSASCGR